MLLRGAGDEAWQVTVRIGLADETCAFLHELAPRITRRPTSPAFAVVVGVGATFALALAARLKPRDARPQRTWDHPAHPVTIAALSTSVAGLAWHSIDSQSRTTSWSSGSHYYTLSDKGSPGGWVDDPSRTRPARPARSLDLRPILVISSQV